MDNLLTWLIRARPRCVPALIPRGSGVINVPGGALSGEFIDAEIKRLKAASHPANEVEVSLLPAAIDRETR